MLGTPQAINGQISIRTPEPLACSKCKNTYLEEIFVRQFKGRHQMVLGQKVQGIDNMVVQLFRCPKCNNIELPNITMFASKSLKEQYEHMIQSLGISTEPPPIPNDETNQ